MANLVLPRLVPGVRPTDDDVVVVGAPNGAGWWMWGNVVLIRCVRGHVCWLPHVIDFAGNCSPSLMCPVPGCGWHEFVRLDGWTGGPRDKQLKNAALRQKVKDLDLDVKL